MEKRKTEAPKAPRGPRALRVIEDIAALRREVAQSPYRGGIAESNALVRSLGLTPITGRTGPKISY